MNDEANRTEPTAEELPDSSPEPVELSEPPPASSGVAGRSRMALTAALVVLVVAVALGTWFALGRDDDEVSTDAGGGGSTEPVPSFWGHRWQVDAIREGNVARKLVPVGGESVVLDATTEGELSYTGCNGGFGEGRLDGDRLVVSQVGSTEMACIDAEGEALMAQDTWLAEFLMAGPTVAIDGEKLTLSTDEATVELTDLGPGEPKEPVDPGSADDPVSNDPLGGGTGGSPGAEGLWGSRWTITQIDLGTGTGDPGSKEGVAALADGSAPVLDTTTEGQINFTGCNGGRGGATLTGDRLSVDGIVATKMACSGPDGEALMAQDATLSTIFEAGPTVSIDGDTLTLVADVGTVVATRT
jgi:heat shock protein HslJ